MNKVRTNRFKGFTLAELIVLIVIISIAATVVIPMIGNSNDLQLSAASRQLASALLYAQTYAISYQKPCQVVFDSTNDTYKLLDANNHALKDPLSQGDYKVDYTTSSSYKNVHIKSVNMDGTQKVWFDRMGAPYSGDISDARPLTTGRITLEAGKLTTVVSIGPVTGRIKVY